MKTQHGEHARHYTFHAKEVYNARAMLNYYKRFVLAFWKDFAKSTKEQLIGALLAVAILALQIHYGVIKDAEIKGNEWAIGWPYITLVAVLFMVHLVRAPWKLNEEHEARHRQHRSERSELEAEISSLKNALEQVAGPKIHLLWDVPKDFASLGKRKNRLIIENASDVDAYHVKIHDVSIDRNKIVTATFDEVNLVRRNTKVTAEVRIIGNVNPEYVDDFEMVYANTQDIPAEYQCTDDKGYQLLKFPMFVSYREYDGKIDFKSEFLFTFDLTTMGLHDGAQFIRCEKEIVKPRPEPSQ